MRSDSFRFVSLRADPHHRSQIPTELTFHHAVILFRAAVPTSSKGRTREQANFNMSSAAALARLTVVCSICIAVTALAARRYARAKGGQASSNTSAAAPAKTCVPPVTLPDKGGSGRSPGGHWKHAAKATSETLTPRSAYARVEGAELRDRVVVAMVGLPARGKSYLSKAVVRYLNLIGCPARIFNSEEHRKTEVRRSSRVSDPGTDDAIATRDQVAMETLDELFSWLRDATATTWLATGASGCACAIFDATNTTVARRQQIVARCADERPPVRLIFLESICDDDELLKHNYRLKLAKTKTNKKEALEDFVGRVKKYEEAYERIEPAEGVSYLQIHNAGQRLVASGLAGYVSTRIVALLHAIHLEPRAIWLVRRLCSPIHHPPQEPTNLTCTTRAGALRTDPQRHERHCRW